MRNSSDTKIMQGKSTKRKRSASWQDNEEEPCMPTRKLTRRLDTAVVNSSVTNIMEGNTAKRKRNACWQDNIEMPSAPARKMSRLYTMDVKSSRRRDSTRRPLHRSAAPENTHQITECGDCQLQPERHADHRHRGAHEAEQVAKHSLVANSSDGPRKDHEGEQIARNSLGDNSDDAPRSAHEDEQLAQHSLVANSSDGPRNDHQGDQVARHSLQDNSALAPRSANEGEQVAQHSLVANISDGPRGDEDEHVARHSLQDNSDDAPRSAHKVEQVAELSTVANSSDEDSVKCPVCSKTFTTQETATPDTCDHTFCAACLQQLSQNKNNCPIDKKTFNVILVRQHTGGEIIDRIHVEPPKRQGECSHEGGEPPCCEYTLGQGLNPVYAAAWVLVSLATTSCVLLEYFPR